MQQRYVLESFLDYWDGLISTWAKGPPDDPVHGCGADPFLNVLVSRSNALHGEAPQNRLVDSNGVNRLDDDVGATRGNVFAICPHAMPEPYWGDPMDCSIVVANLNPGMATLRDQVRSGEQTAHENAVSFMNRFSLTTTPCRYRDFALSNPILMTDEELENRNWSVFSGFNGRGWWKTGRMVLGDGSVKRVQPRHCWTCRHLGVSGTNSAKRPFMMELCGWHSQRWGRAMNWIDQLDESNRNAVKAHLRERVVLPLLQAVECSESRLGLCIGEDWSELLSRDEITDGGIQKGPTQKWKSDDTGTSRTYRVFRWKQTEKDSREFKILVTSAVGTNKPPAAAFFQLEQELLKHPTDAFPGFTCQQMG